MPPTIATYEQVAQAAEALLAEGLVPTIRAVRDRVGGSPNTIHRHLALWKEKRSAPSVPEETALPAGLLREIRQCLANAAQQVREQEASEKQDREREIRDLAEALESAEARFREREDALQTLTDEKALLQGRLLEKEAEIARLRQELEQERQAREKAREEAAEMKGRLSVYLETAPPKEDARTALPKGQARNTKHDRAKRRGTTEKRID